MPADGIAAASATTGPVDPTATASASVTPTALASAPVASTALAPAAIAPTAFASTDITSTKADVVHGCCRLELHRRARGRGVLVQQHIWQCVPRSEPLAMRAH